MPISNKMKRFIDEVIDGTLKEKDVIKKIVEECQRGTNKPRTITNRCSVSKSYLIDKYGFTRDDLKDLKPGDETIKKVKELDETSRATRNNIIINRDVIDKIKKVKDKGLSGMILYAIYSSGRRLNEIINSKFSVKKYTNSNNKVVFSSLSKQKKPTKAVVELLPDTYTAREFIDSIKNIRKMAGNENIYDINRKVNRFSRKNIGSSFTSHTLRGVYGYMSWYLINKQKQNINGYLSSVLNHDSYDTSLNYSKYIMKLDEPESKSESESESDDEPEDKK